MNLNLIDSLNTARRKARLTGKPMTPEEIRGMTEGWFSTEAVLANKKMAAQQEKEEAEKRLSLQEQADQDQRDAARKQQLTSTVSSLGKDAVSTLGMDYMKSKPGESMISKGYEGVKNIFSPVKETAPTFNNALTETELAKQGTVEGAKLAGEGAGAAASEGVGMVAPVEMGGEVSGLSGLTAAEGGGSSSVLGAVGGPLAIIGAAEAVKGMYGGKNIGWGGKNNDWDEKNDTEKMTSAPGTYGSFWPGAFFKSDSVPGKLFKEGAKIERLAMKPIDWVFGNK